MMNQTILKHIEQLFQNSNFATLKELTPHSFSIDYLPGCALFSYVDDLDDDESFHLSIGIASYLHALHDGWDPKTPFPQGYSEVISEHNQEEIAKEINKGFGVLNNVSVIQEASLLTFRLSFDWYTNYLEEEKKHCIKGFKQLTHQYFLAGQKQATHLLPSNPPISKEELKTTPLHYLKGEYSEAIALAFYFVLRHYQEKGFLTLQQPENLFVRHQAYQPHSLRQLIRSFGHDLPEFCRPYVCPHIDSDLLTAFNLPIIKTYKRLISQHLGNLQHIADLISLGFDHKSIDLLLSPISQSFYGCQVSSKFQSAIQSPIFHSYLAEHSPKKLARLFNKEPHWLNTLMDCQKLFDELAASPDSETALGHLSYRGRLWKLEQALIQQQELLSDQAGKVFTYDDTILSRFKPYQHMICQIDGYHFDLPGNDLVLKRVGRQTGLCINGRHYINKVTTGDCLLILMKQDSKVVGCLELTLTNAFTLVQLKANYNKIMSDEMQRAVLKFCEIYKVSIATQDFTLNSDEMLEILSA